MHDWLVFVYKIPPEPSRLRAGVWRKLKAAGALYLQNGVTALPAGTASERTLRGIAEEVQGMGGVAQLFAGRLLGDEEVLRDQFNRARDEEYTDLLTRSRAFHAELARERADGKYTFAELEENEDDLAKLEAWRHKIGHRDTFNAALAREATEALVACRADLESYATEVYATADNGHPPAPDAEQ